MFHKFHAPKQDSTPKFRMPNPDQPLDYQIAGDEFVSHGNIDHAIQMYENGLKLSKNQEKRAVLFHHLAFAYEARWMRTNDIQDASFASSALQKAIDCKPSLVEAYIDLEKLCHKFQEGDHITVKKCTEGLEKDPKMVSIRCIRGCAYLRLSKVEEGISDLVRVLSNGPVSAWTQQATEELREIDKQTILAQIKTFPREEQKSVLAQIRTQKTFLNKIFAASSGFLGYWTSNDQAILNEIHSLNSKLNAKDQVNIDESDRVGSAVERYKML